MRRTAYRGWRQDGLQAEGRGDGVAYGHVRRAHGDPGVTSGPTVDDERPGRPLGTTAREPHSHVWALPISAQR